jgi:uncharacterized membrane protein (DUF106 family)
VSQDEADVLSEEMKQMAKEFRDLKVEIAAADAHKEEQLARLERSDKAQWEIIRDTQTKIMRYAFFVTGAISVMAFLGVADKVRALLMW